MTTFDPEVPPPACGPLDHQLSSEPMWVSLAAAAASSSSLASSEPCSMGGGYLQKWS